MGVHGEILLLLGTNLTIHSQIGKETMVHRATNHCIVYFVKCLEATVLGGARCKNTQKLVRKGNY